MEKTVRLQVEVTQSVMEALERLMERGGLKTKKDLLNTAFTLLNWAVKEKERGNTICSVNEQSLLRKELEMPFLELVAMSGRTNGNEAQFVEASTSTKIQKDEVAGVMAATSNSSAHHDKV